MLKKKLNQLTLAFDVQLNKTTSSGATQQMNNTQEFEALQQLVKIRDKELINQKQQIDQLQQELWNYKNKGYLPTGYEKIQELQSKLKDAESKNFELQKELKSMHKIQVEQGRALEKITDEHDYPVRMTAVVEELRYTKERVRVLEGKLRNEERANKQQHEHMVRLEETIRELKGNSKTQAAIEMNRRGEVNKPYHVKYITLTISLQLAKADEKIEDLNRIIEMLTKTKEKDTKNYHFSKKNYEKLIKEYQAKIDELNKLIIEKDKVIINIRQFEQEMKIQAFKLRNLMQDEFRKSTIKHNFQELDRLASPRQLQRNNPEMQGNAKLLERRLLQDKYGKLPLKPGFNRRKMDFHEKMTLLDIEMYGSQDHKTRSKSVDPFAKVKRLNNTVLDMDKAADQIIENSLNQYVQEVQNEETYKMNNDNQDFLEQMYDNVGGRVFDINHDLNVNTNPHMYNNI